MSEGKWIEVIDMLKIDNIMKERLYRRCTENKGKKHMKLRYYKPVIICASLVCMLVSAPIMARVISTALERMEEMDRREIKSLNDMIQEQPLEIEADSFSRELTEEEQSRKKVLLEEYTYKARFPEYEVSIAKGEPSRLVDEVCYDMQNSKFYLPNRALTDEELLQIIDFNHKRDYSLQVMNKVEKQEVSIKDVNNMEFMEKAEYILENIYGIDAISLERTVEWYNEDEDAYEITFTEGNTSFYIRMEKETLKVEKVSADLKEDLDSYQIITKEIAENETALFEKSKEIIENVLGVDQQIKSEWCNYYIGDGDRGQDRNLNYLFELEDGSAYIFNYVYEEGAFEEGILRAFDYVGNFEWYHQLVKDNEPKNAEKGIERVEFEIDLK